MTNYGFVVDYIIRALIIAVNRSDLLTAVILH